MATCNFQAVMPMCGLPRKQVPGALIGRDVRASQGRGLGVLCGALLTVVALVVVSSAGLVPAPRVPATPGAPTGLTPSGSVDALSYNGVDPTVISLYWAESTDICFTNYTLQYSPTSSNGPWYVIWSTASKTQTSTYVYGTTPGATYWWQIVDNDFCTGPATSNTLQVTQPTVATLTYSTSSESSVSLSWTNAASYGGWVGFGSYTVWESIDNGSFASVATISSASTTSYLANGLSPLTYYQFEVQTTDNLTQSTYSNAIALVTPASLSVTASASRTTVDVGQSATFTCAATGGVGPYAYSWVFGDGTTGSGSTTTHSYSAPGSMDASCTATDSFGLKSSGGVIVSVSTDPQITGMAFSPAAAGPPANHGVDVGQKLGISATATGGHGSYTWSWTGLPTSCTGTTTGAVECVPSSSGDYNISVTVTDANGFSTTSATVTVTVFALPSMTLTVTPGSVLQGNSVAFVATLSGGAGSVTYVWSGLPAGCTAPSGLTLTCSPSAAGTYRVVVTATDQDGGTGFANTTLTVNAAFLGMPAAQGYAVVGGGIAAVVVVAAVAAVLLSRRRKRRGRARTGTVPEQLTTPPPGSPPPTRPGS